MAKKLLVVFGATGNQGGSVIRAVLGDAALSSEFAVRGITRDVGKAAAKELAAKGVEMVQADMSSAEAVAPAVAGAHTVFLVTNFWETMSASTEEAQGRAVADACKAAGVSHLVFSSLINTTEASGGRLPNISHFDGKARIEAYMRDVVPSSFVLPGMFMSNFQQVVRRRTDGGEGFVLAVPEGMTLEGAKAPLFDVVEDSGKFVKAIIKSYPASLGKRVYAATDYYPLSRLLADFSAATGQPAEAQFVPHETFKSFLPAPAAQELLENWLLLEDPGYYGGADLGESLALLGGDRPVAWRDYVQRNRKLWE